MTLSVFKVKQFARGQTLFYEVGYSLVGFSAPRFSMRNRYTGAVVVNSAAAFICDGTYIIDGVSQVLTPANGYVYYAWGVSDLDLEGHYDGEFRLSDAGGKYVFEPPGEEYIPILIGDSI